MTNNGRKQKSGRENYKHWSGQECKKNTRDGRKQGRAKGKKNRGGRGGKQNQGEKNKHEVAKDKQRGSGYTTTTCDRRSVAMSNRNR